MDQIFETASRIKLRIPTSKGFLSVEDLWDLPLQGKDDLNLDALAIRIDGLIKRDEQKTYVSFVDQAQASSKGSEQSVQLHLQLEILKRIISLKLVAKENEIKSVQNSARRQELLAALARKQAAEIEGLSAEQIQAELQALDK